jgi:hypothetical protein
MYDFFEEEYPSTEDESKQIFEHIISNSDLRDYSRVKKYLAVRSEVALQNFETEYVLRTRVEDNYSNIPRDVFICFSSANMETANKISKTLEADGYATWISTKNLRPNNKDNYWADIEKAIINNSIVLVISSAEAMVSKDVQHELELAKKHNKKLIELKIDSSAHTTFFKYIFNGIKWIDGKIINNKVIQDIKDRIFEEIQEIKKSRPLIKTTKLSNPLIIKAAGLFAFLLLIGGFLVYQVPVLINPISSSTQNNIVQSSNNNTQSQSSSINSSSIISSDLTSAGDNNRVVKVNNLGIKEISFQKTAFQPNEEIELVASLLNTSISFVIVELSNINNGSDYFRIRINFDQGSTQGIGRFYAPRFGDFREFVVNQINVFNNNNTSNYISRFQLTTNVKIYLLKDASIDAEPPTLRSVSLETNLINEVFNAKVDVSDNMSGINYALFEISSRSDATISSNFIIFPPDGSKPSNYQFSLPVLSWKTAFTHLAGQRLFVNKIKIYDYSGNLVIYYDDIEKWNIEFVP